MTENEKKMLLGATTDVSPEILQTMKDFISLNEMNDEDKINEDLPDDILENIEEDKSNTVDDLDDLLAYKRAVRKSAINQIDFKDKWRSISIFIFLAFTGLLLCNLFSLIYLSGIKISIPVLKTYTFPKVDSKVILIITTATFVNVFAVILLLFKYIFSPTADLLNHNRDISKY